MIDGVTEGVNAARVPAGIPALLRVARPISRTILIDDAFRINAGRRIVDNPALAVHAARTRIARINRLGGLFPA